MDTPCCSILLDASVTDVKDIINDIFDIDSNVVCLNCGLNIEPDFIDQVRDHGVKKLIEELLFEAEPRVPDVQLHNNLIMTSAPIEIANHKLHVRGRRPNVYKPIEEMTQEEIEEKISNNIKHKKKNLLKEFNTGTNLSNDFIKTVIDKFSDITGDDIIRTFKRVWLLAIIIQHERKLQNYVVIDHMSIAKYLIRGHLLDSCYYKDTMNYLVRRLRSDPVLYREYSGLIRTTDTAQVIVTDNVYDLGIVCSSDKLYTDIKHIVISVTTSPTPLGRDDTVNMQKLQIRYINMVYAVYNFVEETKLLEDKTPYIKIKICVWLVFSKAANVYVNVKSFNDSNIRTNTNNAASMKVCKLPGFATFFLTLCMLAKKGCLDIEKVW